MTNDQWQNTSLSMARRDLSSASVGNFVLFAGGQDENYTQTAVIDIFNHVENTWSIDELSVRDTE